MQSSLVVQQEQVGKGAAGAAGKSGLFLVAIVAVVVVVAGVGGGLGGAYATGLIGGKASSSASANGAPSLRPTMPPTTLAPTVMPTTPTTLHPTTLAPTSVPTFLPTKAPSKDPTVAPTKFPTTRAPSLSPTQVPTPAPNSCSPNASPTSTVTDNCVLLDRDTSSCQASRTAQGISGEWLKFACSVTLTKSGNSITLQSDSVPDYKSVYFQAADSCFQTEPDSRANPNKLAATPISMTVPYAATAAAQGGTSFGGGVGLAVNGVLIFNNAAAPQDNIFQEAVSFDRCQGHPQNQGLYHYHSEPYSISSDDSRLIGVMLDGYFIYGRRDSDGSRAAETDTSSTYTTYFGHVGTRPDGAPNTFHYHATSTVGKDVQGNDVTIMFLSNSKFYGTKGACTGC